MLKFCSAGGSRTSLALATMPHQRLSDSQLDELLNYDAVSPFILSSRSGRSSSTSSLAKARAVGPGDDTAGAIRSAASNSTLRAAGAGRRHSDGAHSGHRKQDEPAQLVADTRYKTRLPTSHHDHPSALAPADIGTFANDMNRTPSGTTSKTFDPTPSVLVRRRSQQDTTELESPSANRFSVAPSLQRGSIGSSYSPVVERAVHLPLRPSPSPDSPRDAATTPHTSPPSVRAATSVSSNDAGAASGSPSTGTGSPSSKYTSSPVAAPIRADRDSSSPILSARSTTDQMRQLLEGIRHLREQTHSHHTTQSAHGAAQILAAPPVANDSSSSLTSLSAAELLPHLESASDSDARARAAGAKLQPPVLVDTLYTSAQPPTPPESIAASDRRGLLSAPPPPLPTTDLSFTTTTTTTTTAAPTSRAYVERKDFLSAKSAFSPLSDDFSSAGAASPASSVTRPLSLGRHHSRSASNPVFFPLPSPPLARAHDTLHDSAHDLSQMARRQPAERTAARGAHRTHASAGSLDFDGFDTTLPAPSAPFALSKSSDEISRMSSADSFQTANLPPSDADDRDDRADDRADDRSDIDTQSATATSTIRPPADRQRSPALDLPELQRSAWHENEPSPEQLHTLHNPQESVSSDRSMRPEFMSSKDNLNELLLDTIPSASSREPSSSSAAAAAAPAQPPAPVATPGELPVDSQRTSVAPANLRIPTIETRERRSEMYADVDSRYSDSILSSPRAVDSAAQFKLSDPGSDFLHSTPSQPPPAEHAQPYYEAPGPSQLGSQRSAGSRRRVPSAAARNEGPADAQRFAEHRQRAARRSASEALPAHHNAEAQYVQQRQRAHQERANYTREVLRDIRRYDPKRGINVEAVPQRTRRRDKADVQNRLGPNAKRSFSQPNIQHLLDTAENSFQLDDLDLPPDERRLLEKFVDALSKLSVEINMDKRKRVEGRRRLQNALRAIEGWI